MAKTVKLTLNSLGEISLMHIGSGDWAAKDAHLPLGKGSGGKSDWIGRAQVDFEDPNWPASGRIVKATLSGKTGATGSHDEFRGGNPAVSLRRLTAAYKRNTAATNDGYYTQNSDVVYPGTSNVDTNITFAVADTGGVSWSKDITSVIESLAPARILKRNDQPGGGAKWYGFQLRSTDEGAAAKSSILSPNMTITIEIDVAATPDQPTIYAIAGQETGTSAPMIVGSADGRTLDVQFTFSSPDPADVCAKAELTLRQVTSTPTSLGPVLYTTGSVVPSAGDAQGVYRLSLTNLPRRTPFRIAIAVTSQNDKTSDWSDPTGDKAHVQTATIPGAPLDRVFQPYTDSPHVLSSLNSPDPDDFITGWHGRFTRVPAGTSAWDSGETDQGGAVRRSDVTWSGGTLADGERISYIERHRNRDQVWGTWSPALEQTMRERVGPTLTPAPSRLTTKRPTFTITAASFDGYRLRLLDGDRVLYDTGATAGGPWTTISPQIPAGVLAFGQRFTAVASVRPAGSGVYGAESTAQEYTVTALPVTALSVLELVGRGRVGTRDIGFKRSVTDADGDTPQAVEIEIRAAATPQGSGALRERRLDTGTISELVRLGRQLATLQATAGWSTDANVAVAAYSATNPTGYSGNSLEVQGTGASSTDRGARYTFTTPVDLSGYGAGAIIAIHRRCTSVTNLTRWVVRFEFATTGDWAQFELIAAGGAVNTWAEVTVPRGTPQSTSGTQDWTNVTAIRLFADVSAAYTGNLEVRDMRIGTVQTAKDTPDGHIAWEAAVDVRARARDDAAALVTATTLSAQANAGTTTPSLTSTAGLEVGMSLLIAGTVPEVREIVSLAPVTLNEALSWTHASGQAVTAYPWGAWSGWQTVTAMQPPTVAADTPADAALITTPTPALAHTYSSIRAQAARTTELYRRRGLANRIRGLGPASFLRLSETAGSFADEMAAITGTANGTIARGATGLIAPYDTDACIDLDGSTGYVTFGDVYDFAGVTPFTIAMLLRPDALATGYARALSKEGTDGWRLMIHSTGQALFDRHTAGGTDTAAGPTNLVVGTTSLVVVTYDGTQITVFVDGVAGAPVASSRTLGGNANALTLGRQANGAVTYYNGKADDLAVFTRALTADEVEALAAGLAETAADTLLLAIEVAGAGLSDDVPPFLLDDGQFYGWRKVITDAQGLAAATALRSFRTSFTVPAAAASLTATADPSSSSVLLEWPALDPDTWVEVETQLEDGSWIRIDGGPEELLDGLTPFTGTALRHVGARLGDNVYRLAISNGWRSSDGISADAVLDETTYEGWVHVVLTTGEVLAFPAGRRTREPRFTSELFTPPGGSATVLKWGRTGGVRRLTATLWDDLWPVRRRLVALASSSTGIWVKDRTGDPAWVQITEVGEDLTDNPAIEDLDVVLQEVGEPVHAIDPEA